MTVKYTNPDLFMHPKMKEWQEDFFNTSIKESEFSAYNTIINFYYENPAVIRIFIAASSYYVSNKILCKLSETMTGYQNQIVHRSVSSLMSEMGAMMQGRSPHKPPLKFITKYGRDVADRVYYSLIEREGMDDEIALLLNMRYIRESKVGFLLTLSDSYIHLKMHSILSYLIKITGVV